ncbi:MAG: hypothetical protein [Gemykibivirus turti1]|uniref:Uncharacterized protein n=1 Tax=Genomoviridae sp. TaxID=2202565 RepID=A0A3G2YSS8_9VIRU|nr:MAG: hypothetical protein QKB91_gp1 [Genomoviridae sp.]AYP28709.1 MAG: hypothetical protein [Genomoviridae sp.]
MDPIKQARLHELRALKAARESGKCLNANESTPPGNGMVERENRAPAAPADQPDHDACPLGRSSIKRVRKSGITCLATAIPPMTTRSRPITSPGVQLCDAPSELSSLQSSPSSGTQLDAPPRILPGSVEVKPTSPFARRNRFLPLALRNASNWKPITPHPGSGDESASQARMTSVKPTLTRQTSFVERQMEWSD